MRNILEQLSHLVDEARNRDPALEKHLAAALRRAAELHSTKQIHKQLDRPQQDGEIYDLTVYERQLAADPGRKIEAIKEIRARTGLGLKDAKDLVEAYQARHF